MDADSYLLPLYRTRHTLLVDLLVLSFGTAPCVCVICRKVPGTGIIPSGECLGTLWFCGFVSCRVSFAFELEARWFSR